MNYYNELIKKKKLTQLFTFGMYRSGTTVIARSLAGEKNIAFASDPIRPFFNWYRTNLQKKIGLVNGENSNQPLGDYFNGSRNYINKLISSDFSELISLSELKGMRKNIIEQGNAYSPKFLNVLRKENILDSITYSDELKYYLYLIRLTYGNDETRIIGLKEVWSIEMAFPLINMIGSDAKILLVLRDPLDIIASSVSGSANYSILTLARQWRKQIVFYSLLKSMYPDQVILINYEEFCLKPTLTLRQKIEYLIGNNENFLFEKLSPIDDSGNSWIKNSSYQNEDFSENIDQESVGKYKDVLNDSEIEWIIYLTHMSTYKKYNHENIFPRRPVSKFPKRDITSVADWAKSEIISLEGINLEKELQNEYIRVEKMKNSTSEKKNDINLLTSQF